MFVIDQLRLVSTITSGIFIIGLLFYWNLDILAWLVIKALAVGLSAGALVCLLWPKDKK